ncbi:M20/M25/M40 family metallo-hydrolase [bacterium]|nr:M20/M25/M40 family metallo-hydrolase [candidate division CSSED10-310 bacterium]
MNRESIIERFMELCRIPAASGNERKTADYCTAVLKELGADVREDCAAEKTGGNAGNVIGTFRGTDPTIPPVMLNAHMDTVFSGGPVIPILDNGWIRSAGNTILGADNRTGIVMILEGMRRFLLSKQRAGDIEIVLTVGEEIGLVGAGHLDVEKIRSRYGFSLDSSGLGRLVKGAPFYQAIDVSIEGRSAHAAVNADQGINSIDLMARSLSGLPFGQLDDESTANIGQIIGGSARNVIPDDCRVVMEVRSHSEAKVDAYCCRVRRSFQRVCGPVHVDVDGVIHRPNVVLTMTRECDGFFLSPDAATVQTAMTALQKIGRTVDLYRNMGGSDANIFNARGIETVVVGTGQRAVHSVDECIAVEDLIDGIRLVPELISAWTGWWSQKRT